MKIDKIIVIADILRGEKGLDYNTPWLYALIKHYVGTVSHIPVIKIEENNATVFQKKFFEIMNIKLTYHSWIDAYNLQPSAELINYMRSFFDNSFVIAFELHPLLQKVFDELGIQYLKLMNHPIRYMDDIFFGMSSNNEQIYNKLKKYQINEELYKQYACFLKAEFAVKKFTKKVNILPNSAVFFAQTNIDCSLLENNTIHSLYDYMDRFTEITNQFEHVYYKIHPMGRNQELIDYIKKIPHVIVPKPNAINSYDFISSENISKCFSISSGALYEARYFGKETEYFYKQPFDFINDKKILNHKKENIFIPIYKEYWQPSFWADILSPVISVFKEIPILPKENYSNKMRRIINMNWGYRDFDSVEINKDFANRAMQLLKPMPIASKNQGSLFSKVFMKIYKFFVNMFLCFIPYAPFRKKIRICLKVK